MTVVRAGTAVHFPNHDRIRHHVYSFSRAKTFEIPPVQGEAREARFVRQAGGRGPRVQHPRLDVGLRARAGDAVFAVTGADGKARIDGLPPGEYDVEAWHPQMRAAPRSARQGVAVTREKGGAAAFVIQQAPAWRAWRAPTASGGGYR